MVNGIKKLIQSKNSAILFSGATLLSFIIAKPTIDFTQMATKELYLYDKIGHTLTDLKDLENYAKLTTREENQQLINMINPSYLTEEEKRNSFKVYGSIITKINDQYARILIPSKKDEDSLKIGRIEHGELDVLSNTSTEKRIDNPKITEKAVKYLSTEELALISANVNFTPIQSYRIPQIEKDEEATTNNNTNTTTNIKEIISFSGQKEKENFTKTLITVAYDKPEYRCKIAKLILGYNTFIIEKYPAPEYQYTLYKPIDIANECINNKEELKEIFKKTESSYRKQRICAIYYRELEKIKNGEIYLDTYENISASFPDYPIKLYETAKDLAKNCDEETKQMANLPDIYYQAVFPIRDLIRNIK